MRFDRVLSKGLLLKGKEGRMSCNCRGFTIEMNFTTAKESFELR
jgi:hypothetical protein